MNLIKIVEWVDSSLTNVQVDRYDFPKPERIVSLGWVVEENDEYITLTRDDMQNGDYRGLVCIPKVSVLSIRSVETTNKEEQHET